MANVGVIGAGSWGTALSVLLHDNGHSVTVWSIDESEVKMLDEKREHLLKLPGVKLPGDMVFTGDLDKAIQGKDFLVLAVPSVYTRSTARSMKPYVADGQIIVDVAKGIEESEPRGGGRAETADHLRDRREDEKDCRVSPVHVHQQGVPRLHKP